MKETEEMNSIIYLLEAYRTLHSLNIEWTILGTWIIYENWSYIGSQRQNPNKFYKEKLQTTIPDHNQKIRNWK